MWQNLEASRGKNRQGAINALNPDPFLLPSAFYTDIDGKSILKHPWE
jgi:hypothetical protein